MTKFRVSILLLISLITFQNTDLRAQDLRNTLSDKDKIEIVSDFLQRINFLDDKETKKDIYLSAENIPAQMLDKLPAIKGITFILVSPEEIKKKIAEGRFEYYSFGSFETKKLYRQLYLYRYIIQDYVGYESGVGWKFQYQKVRGKWKGKIIGFFSSIS